MDITHITSLLGGIALFLYGMSIMGAGLEKLAGGKMQGVLQKLLADRFIDDNRYAEAFVRDKIRLSGWGARKIRTSLRLKGIAAAIIDEALARLDPANQSERLRTQLEKKLRLTRYKDTYDLKTKLIRYGLSLGYDYDAVLDAAGELIQTNDEPGRRASGSTPEITYIRSAASRGFTRPTSAKCVPTTSIRA